MSRQERRRAERESRKNGNAVSTVPLNIANYNVQQISSLTGARIDSLKTWIAAREEEMHQAYIKEFQEKLFRAENYVAVANIFISILAINMTWGFTKSNQRFLDNINAATELLNKKGVEAVYKEIHDKMELSLEFDNIDINKEFGFDREDL